MAFQWPANGEFEQNFLAPSNAFANLELNIVIY